MKRLIIFSAIFTIFFTATACNPLADKKLTSVNSEEIVEKNSCNNITAERAKQISGEYLVKTISQYDKNGNILSVTTNEYDENYRCISEITENFSYNTRSVTQHKYNSYSGLLEQSNTTVKFDFSTTTGITEYTYDSNGKQTALYYTNGKLEQKNIYSKDKLLLESQLYTDTSTFYYIYEYDSNGDLVSASSYKQETSGSVKSWPEINYSHEYTSFGLKSTETNLNNGSYNTYEYDDNYCLIKINSYNFSSTNNSSTQFNGRTEYEYISKKDIIPPPKSNRQEFSGTNGYQIEEYDLPSTATNTDTSYQNQAAQSEPIIATYTNPNPVNIGDTIILSGTIKKTYSNEYYIEGTSVTYVYHIDMYGTKYKYTDDKVYFLPSENDLIKNLTGQNITIKGIATPQSHGILNIKEIFII